jgi:uncharacterized protein (TIGR02466 family)
LVRTEKPAEPEHSKENLNLLALISSGGRVENIFPTPIFWYILKDCEILNGQLRDVILAKEAHTSSAAKSNIGGWQSPPDFFTWKESAAAYLEQLIHCALEVATTRVMARKLIRAEFDLYGWAAVNRQGHYNVAHLHPMATWSGVYYVDPGDEPSDALGACLEFAHPISASTMNFFPGILPSARQVRPVAGMIIIFPSYLLHSVRLYRGERPRVCVSFNAHLREVVQAI